MKTKTLLFASVLALTALSAIPTTAAEGTVEFVVETVCQNGPPSNCGFADCGGPGPQVACNDPNYPGYGCDVWLNNHCVLGD